MFKEHFYTNWTTEKGKQFGITVYTSKEKQICSVATSNESIYLYYKTKISIFFRKYVYTFDDNTIL